MKLNRAKIKIVIIILLAILGVVLMATNSKTVRDAEHIWFFGKWNMPVWQLVVITLVIGFVVGVLVGSRIYEQAREGKAEKRDPGGNG